MRIRLISPRHGRNAYRKAIAAQPLNIVAIAQSWDRRVIRVSSDGRPSRIAKPGHRAVPLLT